MHQNKFYKALERNEIKAFLLGKGYYYSGWSEMERGKHAIYRSLGDIIDYTKENPDKKNEIFSLLDVSLQNILHTLTDANTLLDVSMYVWDYFIAVEEKKLQEDEWKMSNEFLSSLSERYHIVLSSNNIDKELENLLTIHKRLLKERFNFEISSC